MCAIIGVNQVRVRGCGRAEGGVTDSAWGSGWLPAGGGDLEDLETVVVGVAIATVWEYERWNQIGGRWCRPCFGVSGSLDLLELMETERFISRRATRLCRFPLECHRRAGLQAVTCWLQSCLTES